MRYTGGTGGGGGGTSTQSQRAPSPDRKKKKPDYCKNIAYQIADIADRLAGYGQIAALGGGLIGQTEPYPVARNAFKLGGLQGYVALGAVRDVATLTKFALGNRSSVGDLVKTLAIKGAGLDAAREVLADTFGNLVDKATDKQDPCKD